MQEIDVKELSEILNKQAENGLDAACRFIDVRTTSEVTKGMIAGAENIPLHIIPLKIQELKTSEKLIVYCRTGARSAQACHFLTSNGITNVTNVRGGIVAWAQQGYPISY